MIVHAAPSTPRLDDGDDSSLVQATNFDSTDGGGAQSENLEDTCSSIGADSSIDGDVSDVWLDDGNVEYRILDTIGGGSYGRVFAAEATPWDQEMRFPRQVAIKALSKKAMISDGCEFFDALTERLNLASCNDGGDSSVTTLLSSFQDEQNVYFVMVSLFTSFILCFGLSYTSAQRLYATDLEVLLESRTEPLPWEVICLYTSELVRHYNILSI